MRTNGKPNLARAAAPAAPYEAEFDEAARGMETVAPMMQVRSTYSTAVRVQKARNLNSIKDAVLVEAELAGEDFFYTWTQKGELVEGPSIEGAMILARNWGNCAAESSLAQDGTMHWILSATFIDLETGFSLVRPFRQRKSEAHSKADEDRNVDQAFQIGVSKATRNVVLKAMPMWLVNQAMEKAKEAAEGKYKDIPKWIEVAKKKYAAIGVTQQELEAKIGRPTSAWTTGDLATLQAILRSIDARMTSVEKEFRTTEDGEIKPGPAAQQPAQPPASPQAPTSPSATAKAPDAKAPEPIATQPEGPQETATMPPWSTAPIDPNHAKKG